MILEVDGPVSQEAIEQIHEVLRFCNAELIPLPVWANDEEVRNVVLGSEQFDMSEISSTTEGLFFDLPQHKGYHLVYDNDVLFKASQELGELIRTDRVKSQLYEMKAGFGLLQLDFSSRVHGKAQFWSQNFNVKNRSAYCSKILGIKESLGSQYIASARNLEFLKPGFLGRLFLPESESLEVIPHGYTLYRDLTPYMTALLDIRNTSNFPEVESMIFNPDLSSRQLLKELRGKIISITGKDPLPPKENKSSIKEAQQSNLVDEENVDIFGRIEQFKEDLIKLVPDEYIERFNIYIEGFADMFRVDSMYGPIDFRLEEEARVRFANEPNKFADLAPWETE